MRLLEHLLIELADSLPDGAGGEAYGVRVEVQSAELTLPIESTVGKDGETFASPPRGRQATGFDAPLGKLRLAFARGGA